MMKECGRGENDSDIALHKKNLYKFSANIFFSFVHGILNFISGKVGEKRTIKLRANAR